MSDSRDLEVKLKIDRSQAKQAIDQHDAQLAASKQKAFEHFLAINKVIKKFGDDVEDVGKKGSKSFLDMAAAGAVVYTAFNKTLAVLQSISVEIDRQKQKSKELSNSFADDRDRYRELAFIMGRQSDNAFVLEQKNFNMKAAMNTAEGLSFRTQFQNAGAQFAGKTMTAKESKDFEQQAAQLSSALGLKSNEAGDFFGTVSGLRDRTAMGDKASESTLADARRIIGILGRGKGDNPVLINQFAQIASASLSEDEMKGVFQNPEDIASFISVGAEKSDARSGYMLRAAIRGMRDFSGDAGPLLARAGVNAKTPLMQGIKSIAKPIEDEARVSGLKTEDIVRKYFVDEETVNAVSTYINKGVSGGLFSDRESFAAGLPNETALNEIKNFQGTSEVGIRRQALSQKELGEAEASSGKSRIEILRKQAEAELAKQEAESPGFAGLENLLIQATSLGMANPHDSKVESIMGNIIERRARGYGINVDATSAVGASLPETGDSRFSQIFSQIDAVGGNPLIDAMTENNRLLKENNDLIRKQTGGQTVPPALPSNPQQPRR